MCRDGGSGFSVPYETGVGANLPALPKGSGRHGTKCNRMAGRGETYLITMNEPLSFRVPHLAGGLTAYLSV